jgi:UDP-N-acetylmuramoyl-L-alanyl-D-glutamate--2,6-diaminopimelate ligase
MKLNDLIADTPVRLLRPANAAGAVLISAITEDSRAVTHGSLFVARRGGRIDGRSFIPEAIARGAAAVLTDDAASPEAFGGAAIVLAEDVLLAAARMAERFFGSPSSELALIGVTGTNGKTTTCYVLRHVLACAGVRCGLIGTVEIDDGRRAVPAELTTPPAVELSRLMRAMADNGCRACVMEASSHALDQRRTAGLDFRGAIFTNLGGGGGDHMDYHGSVEAYIAAKAKLLAAASGFAVVNIDDPASPQMIDAVNPSAALLTCGLSESEARCAAEISAMSKTHCDAVFRGPWGAVEVHLPLCGRHNVMNALQAAAAAHALGVDAAVLREALATCPAPPGRLQPVTASTDPFAVYVDYAHTDDALDNVLRALRPLAPRGSARLRVVFGCGGDRDRTKRPRMAAAAWRWADDVIVTSDNPRTEDPDAILRDIRAGVPAERLGATDFIVDRAAAIHEAIGRSRGGDVVLIAGKGHEDYQIIGDRKRPFDDRLVAAEALARLHERAVTP